VSYGFELYWKENAFNILKVHKGRMTQNQPSGGREGKKKYDRLAADGERKQKERSSTTTRKKREKCRGGYTVSPKRSRAMGISNKVFESIRIPTQIGKVEGKEYFNKGGPLETLSDKRKKKNTAFKLPETVGQPPEGSTGSRLGRHSWVASFPPIKGNGEGTGSCSLSLHLLNSWRERGPSYGTETSRDLRKRTQWSGRDQGRVRVLGELTERASGKAKIVRG